MCTEKDKTLVFWVKEARSHNHMLWLYYDYKSNLWVWQYPRDGLGERQGEVSPTEAAALVEEVALPATAMWRCSLVTLLFEDVMVLSELATAWN